MKSSKPGRTLAEARSFKPAFGYLLRRAHRLDLEPICQIENEAHLRPWSREGLAWELDSESQSIFWVLCTRGSVDEVIAYICFRLLGPEFYLLNLAVKEEFRQKGLGGWLLLTAMGFGLKKGVKKAVLDVHRENYGAIRFYQGLGFRFAEPIGKNKKIFRVMEVKFL